MKISTFIVVGENIHCTRIYKVGGKNVVAVPGGGHAVEYKSAGQVKHLPVPAHFTQSADWAAGKVKHCAVAIWQGNYGDKAAQTAGVEYLQHLAREQEAAGASYLDINVDEFSTDVAERVRLIQWTVNVVQKAVRIPASIDSSNMDILRAGLEACDRARGRPMVNSVSLERQSAVAVARELNAVVIASAAGEKGLPSNNEERIQNIRRLMTHLLGAGFDHAAIHVDPLVFPISTDGNNGKAFLETVTAVRAEYGKDIHIVAGLSNVSFGLPNRKLINQVFALLAAEAGADGGIVDPLQINARILNSLDTQSEAFKLAKDLLLGVDDFGMNYIAASRDGRV